MNFSITGVATLKHKETGKTYKIKSDSLDWDWEYASNDESSERIYETEIPHPKLGTFTWFISEYPVNSENQQYTSLNEYEIVRGFDCTFNN